MAKDNRSNKYPGNEIIKHNGADAVGNLPSRTSDVHWRNTATKLEGGAHNLGNIKYNISDNTITALHGESDVGMFRFQNVVVYWSNAGRGQGGREGNKGHKVKAGGSSSAQGQGGRGGTKPKGDVHNIRGNNIKGDGDPKAFHNFSNIEYNLMTTNKEHDGSTGQANIRKNTITARNGASYVGMFNFHNVDVWSNAGQGQGGRQGNKGFLKPEGISHNICNNKIWAYKSRNVGLQNFGNLRHNCKTIIYGYLGFVGLWYLF